MQPTGLGLEVSWKPNPEREREPEPEEVEASLDWKVLRKKGRRVGMQAATMTTFCSILEARALVTGS